MSLTLLLPGVNRHPVHLGEKQFEVGVKGLQIIKHITQGSLMCHQCLMKAVLDPNESTTSFIASQTPMKQPALSLPQQVISLVLKEEDA